VLLLVLAPAWLIFLLRLRGRESAARPRWRLLAGLLLLTTLVVFWDFAFPLKNFINAFPIDDSYITLTAARNVAEHNLFAINTQYPLAGITSPLHVAITGLVAKLMPVEFASRVVGLFSFLAVALGVLLWAKELGARPTTAAASSAICVLCGPLGFGALNGLETVPFAALLIWSFYVFEVAWRRTRLWLLTGLLIGLSILTRPEGWFLAAALYLAAAYRLWREKALRERRRVVYLALSGLVALVVLSPYLLANYHYYHQLFPSTVAAKKYFFSDYCRSIFQRVSAGLVMSWLALGPFTALLPLLYWSRSYLRRIYPWLFVLIFYLAYFSQFVGALGHYWGRYQHPLLPVLLVGVIMGAEVLYKSLGRGRLARVGGIGFALFLFVTATIGGLLEYKMYRNALVNSQSFLMSITDYIRNNTEPGDVVATHDVGALYYFGERPVLDLVGLADPSVAKLYQSKPSFCRSPNARRSRLYHLAKARRPRLIYFSPRWDDWFLGLRRMDRGRHMQKAWHLSHDYQLNDRSDATVYEYEFYKCDWDHDLTAEAH